MLRKRVAVLVAAAMLLLVTMVASAPSAFAQGGCKEFGVNGVSDQARNQEGGMGGYASFFGKQGAMDDQIHKSRDVLCSGSGR